MLTMVNITWTLGPTVNHTLTAECVSGIFLIKIRLKIAPGGNLRNISFLSLKYPWNTAWIFIVISYYILYIIWVGHKVPMKISLTLRIDKATSHLDSLIFFKKAKFFFHFIFFILGTKYKKRFYIKYVLCAKSCIFHYYFFLRTFWNRYNRRYLNIA